MHLAPQQQQLAARSHLKRCCTAGVLHPSPSESARNLKLSHCSTTDESGDGLSTAMPAGMKRQAAPSLSAPATTCPHVLLLPKFVAPAAVCDAAGMLAGMSCAHVVCRYIVTRD